MQTMPFHAFRPDNLRDRLFRLPEVNWYQVAVVAVTTFAISMDLMFPPSRMVFGNGLTVYAGHFFAPLSMPAAAHVDFAWLAAELLAIIALAIIGWNLEAANRSRANEDERDT